MTIEEFAKKHHYDLTTEQGQENFQKFLFHVNEILSDAQEVNAAIINYGKNPIYHLYVMQTTFEKWPTLGRTVKKLSNDVNDLNNSI